MLRQVIASLAVIAAAATGVVVSSSVPAYASAAGCTPAPGNALAANCIRVTGRSLTVTNARSVYHVGLPPVNVCRPRARFKYLRHGTRAYVSFVVAARTCGFGVAWIDWAPHFRFADKSRLCAQQLNDHTNGSYANYACINVIR